MAATRFDMVEVTLSCGCQRTDKRWMVEQHMNPGDATSCPSHGRVVVGADDEYQRFAEAETARMRREIDPHPHTV